MRKLAVPAVTFWLYTRVERRRAAEGRQRVHRCPTVASESLAQSSKYAGSRFVSKVKIRGAVRVYGVTRQGHSLGHATALGTSISISTNVSSVFEMLAKMVRSLSFVGTVVKPSQRRAKATEVTWMALVDEAKRRLGPGRWSLSF